MITISRRLALKMRAVIRRALGTRRLAPAVRFTVAAGTLSVKARSADIAIEHHLPIDTADETLWLPFEFLDDCSGKRDEPVRIESTGKGRVTAQWRDGSVPQIVQYDSAVPPDADKFPTTPETFTENPSGLLKALDDARDTTDPAPTRFAMDCVQWGGATGSLTASDGRHLLVQSGYQFPWQEDLLIPGSKVFGSPELPQDAPIRIGKIGNWVAVVVEPWTIYLAVNVDGRFPDVARHIPSAAEAKAHCSFSVADARFLAETLPRLPCDDDGNRAVTLDLNGHVAVRAKPSDSTRPTEVVLTGSSFSGEPIRVNTNRNYLARAMRLGLRELNITSDETALACFDEHRQYVWMPLSAESAIPPATDAIRIESPGTGVETPATQPQTRRRVSPVTEPVTNSNGNADSNGNGQANGHAKTNGQAKTNGEARKTTGRKAELQDAAALIEQAEKLRTALHDLMHQANGLVKAQKQHRRQSRAIQSTLDSIRQLKGLGV